jgi:hypothetical protein
VVLVLAVPFGLSAGFFEWSGFSRTEIPFTNHCNTTETNILWFLVQVVLFLYMLRRLLPERCLKTWATISRSCKLSSSIF